MLNRDSASVWERLCDQPSVAAYGNRILASIFNHAIFMNHQDASAPSLVFSHHKGRICAYLLSNMAVVMPSLLSPQCHRLSSDTTAYLQVSALRPEKVLDVSLGVFGEAQHEISLYL